MVKPPERTTVNIDGALAQEISKQPDASGQTMASMVKRLIYEALVARSRKPLTPLVVEKYFPIWGKDSVLSHLNNLVKWLSTEKEDELTNNFVRSLAGDPSLCNNADLALLAQKLEIDVVELTKIRNLVWENKNNKTV